MGLGNMNVGGVDKTGFGEQYKGLLDEKGLKEVGKKLEEIVENMPLKKTDFIKPDALLSKRTKFDIIRCYLFIKDGKRPTKKEIKEGWKLFNTILNRDEQLEFKREISGEKSLRELKKFIEDVEKRKIPFPSTDHSIILEDK